MIFGSMLREFKWLLCCAMTGIRDDCASRLAHARSRLQETAWTSAWLWGSMYELISICGGDMRIHTCSRVAAESAHKALRK